MGNYYWIFQKKNIALAAVLLFLMPSFVMAQKLSLERMGQYLDEISLMKSDFTQINSDGTHSKGIIYLKRPGKMRFEYTIPHNALVLVYNWRIVIVDSKSNTEHKIYPLRKSPLNLILDKNFSLKDRKNIKNHYQSGDYTHLVLHDPNKHKFGDMTLVFENEPVVLRRLILTQENNQKTIIVFNNIRPEKKISNRLFEPPDTSQP